MRLYYFIAATLCIVCAVGCENDASPTLSEVAADPAFEKAFPEGQSLADCLSFESVQLIISDQLGLELGQIQPTSTLKGLGCDELDLVELIMEFEDSFDVSIPDNKNAFSISVNDWVALISNLQEANKNGG